MSELRREYTIPVFPHVRKFIAHRYGLRSPIKVSETIPLGNLITLSLLDKRPRILSSEVFSPEISSKVRDQITFILTAEQIHMGPQIKKLISINITVDQLFKENMITYILAQKSLGMLAKTSCKYFLAEMGINESEYSIDTAYKYYRRSSLPPLQKEGLVG
jgi:hypothetical protein